MKAIRSPVKLALLHQLCSCITNDCRLKGTIVLVLPAGSECLNCDLCKVFDNKKRKPDYIIYININGYKPQWVLVEAKRSAKNTYPVEQIKKGIKRMKDNPQSFAVYPPSQALLGILAHNRKKVRVSQLILANAKYRIEYGGIIGKVIPLPRGAKIEQYLIPS